MMRIRGTAGASTIMIVASDAPLNLGEMRVSSEGLAMSTRMLAFLKPRNIRSTSALLSLLRAVPHALTIAFGWTMREIRAFTARLLVMLRRVLPVEVLVKRPPVRHAMGLRAPAWR